MAISVVNYRTRIEEPVSEGKRGMSGPPMTRDKKKLVQSKRQLKQSPKTAVLAVIEVLVYVTRRASKLYRCARE